MEPNQQNKQAKQNRTRDSEIKNKRTVTREEGGGDSGEEREKGFQEQL